MTAHAPLPAPYPSSGSQTLSCSSLHQGWEAEPGCEELPPLAPRGKSGFCPLSGGDGLGLVGPGKGGLWADGCAQERWSPGEPAAGFALRCARATKQRWPRCFPGATTTTKDGFGGRRVGSNPGQRSGAFSSCSTTPSAQGPQRLHADGALAFCHLPITSLQSQLDLLREKDLPSERTDLRKIAAKRKSGENSSQGSGLCWSG